jgi:hypothetical protein
MVRPGTNTHACCNLRNTGASLARLLDRPMECVESCRAACRGELVCESPRRRLLSQLRRAAVSGRRSALRGRFFLVAGQVRNLAWSPSLLVRSWHLKRRPSNGRATQSPQRASATLNAAGRRGPIRARAASDATAAGAVGGFRAEEASRTAARWSKPARCRKNITKLRLARRSARLSPRSAEYTGLTSCLRAMFESVGPPRQRQGSRQYGMTGSRS